MHLSFSLIKHMHDTVSLSFAQDFFFHYFPNVPVSQKAQLSCQPVAASRSLIHCLLNWHLWRVINGFLTLLVLVLRLLSYVLVLREIQGPSSNSDHWFQLPVPVILVNDCAVRNKIMKEIKTNAKKQNMKRSVGTVRYL